MNGANRYTHITLIQTYTHTHTHIIISIKTHAHTHIRIQFLISEVASEVNWNRSTVKKAKFSDSSEKAEEFSIA